MARKPIIDRDDAARPGTDGSKEAGAESVSESNPFAVSADVGAESVSESDPFAVSADVGQEGFSELSDISRNVVPDDAGQHALATALGDGNDMFVSTQSGGVMLSEDNMLDDTLGQALDASTQQGGAPALQDQVVTGIGLTENLVADSTEAIEEEEVDAPDATEVT